MYEDCRSKKLQQPEFRVTPIINITPDLPFLNIHNPIANERISVYFDKYSHMSLDTKNYFVKQISHLSKGVVIVASA